MFLASPDPSEAANRFFKSSAHPAGFVMNLARPWAWRPDVYDGFGALRSQLAADSSLSKRDQAVIVCATAAAVGDSYCCLAWGKTLSEEAGAAAAVIADLNQEALSSRDRALAGWARKVVANPNRPRLRMSRR